MATSLPFDVFPAVRAVTLHRRLRQDQALSRAHAPEVQFGGPLVLVGLCKGTRRVKPRTSTREAGDCSGETESSKIGELAHPARTRAPSQELVCKFRYLRSAITF